MTDRLCIATWIVLDKVEEATDFPSVGENSSRAAFQLVYWRCVATFFATSLAHDPEARHVLYSNVDVAEAAPPGILAHLRALGVEFRLCDITFRLPSGSVSRWGNQFYVLDVIRDFAAHPKGEALVLVDSDCVIRRALTPLLPRIREHRCLTYTLRPRDQKNYELGQLLNGMSHARMGQVLEETFGASVAEPPQYHGGEFFAATHGFCRDLLPRIEQLWPRAVAEARWPDSIKEEAHFLSILAYAQGVPPYTANDVIRRIWTNFEDINTQPDDAALAIWHVPAEKKYGIRRLWRHMERRRLVGQRLSPETSNRLTRRYIGVPRRGPVKLLQDVAEKLRERLRQQLARSRPSVAPKMRRDPASG